MGDILTKLALEVEKNESKGKGFDSKGNKPGTGNEKDNNGKKFPFKSGKGEDSSSNTKSEGRDNNEKKDGKVQEAGKESVGQNGAPGSSNSNVGKQEEEKIEQGIGGEKEIPGNEQAEGSPVSGGSPDPTTIIDFLSQNPMPNDEEFHEFAESQGIDIHQAESIAYALAGKYVMFLRGGKSGGGQIDMSQIDPEQLKIGMEVESEHSDDPVTQKKIFLDHYTEDKEYYNKLKKYVEGNNEQVVAEPKENVENKFKKNIDKQSNL